MKSMCQEPRRSSPSVASCRPIGLLQAHRLADRLILDRAQLVGVDGARRVVGPGLQQRRRAQQAADVIGAERRLGTPGHGSGLYRRLFRMQPDGNGLP